MSWINSLQANYLGISYQTDKIPAELILLLQSIESQLLLDQQAKDLSMMINQVGMSLSSLEQPERLLLIKTEIYKQILNASQKRFPNNQTTPTVETVDQTKKPLAPFFHWLQMASEKDSDKTLQTKIEPLYQRILNKEQLDSLLIYLTYQVFSQLHGQLNLYMLDQSVDQTKQVPLIETNILKTRKKSASLNEKEKALSSLKKISDQSPDKSAPQHKNKSSPQWTPKDEPGDSPQTPIKNN
jgi:hypothetical protein